jgi:type I restriction enzyme S subunit
MSWDLKPFGDLYAIPSRNGLSLPADKRGYGCKMINMGELFAYPKIKNPDMARVQPSENEIEKYSVEKDDLLFARRSLVLEGAGKCAIVAEHEHPTVFESSIIRVRLNKEICDPVFYFYFFRSQAGFGFIQQIVNQVAVAGIRGSDLERMKIIYPPLPVQQKIAAILSAYDDLIENNNKRIALLEKAAEEIYREWFVRMRFPGWEQVKFVKGIPADWEVIKVADAFEFLGGGTPSTAETRYWDDGTVNWFTPSDITKANGIFLPESIDKCTEEGLNNSSARMFPAYSVMMTSRATIGAIGINTTPACTNQGFITCIPNENFPLTFLYHWLKLNKPHFELLATGATFAELTKGTFKKIKIIKPEKTLVEQYDEKVAPMFKEMESLLQKVVLLKQSRDLLLSRLISGKLSVEALEIRFPPSMIAQ